MRVFVAQLLFALLASAQPALYVAGSVTSDYVVGAKLPPSGLFRCSPDGACEHLGYNLPVFTVITADPSSPGSILLAGGNGLIRAANGGREWTILTGSDVTELRDIALDPADSRTIYYSYVHGIRVSRDAGKSWAELGGGLRRKYTESIRTLPGGALVAGTERGIWRSVDSGAHWMFAGAPGIQILRLEASPHDPCTLIAATQGAGLFASADCGKSFENAGRQLGVGRNTYDVAFDPFERGRVAAGGFGTGVAISEDGGKTWQARNNGLPSLDVTAVVFDPSRTGRLLAAVHGAALYASDDLGAHWTKFGMDSSRITCMRFLEVRQ